MPIFAREGSAFQKIMHRIRLVAATDMSVMIFGENGTGKEHIAHLLHDKSKRAGKPFVAVDCGSLSKELAPSAFFGHVKGAFTGADNAKKGYFHEAEGGTLFLDEVGNLALETQQMLLRAIQERRYRPVGDKADRNFNVRIIAATNEDLEVSVNENPEDSDLVLGIFSPAHRPSLPRLHGTLRKTRTSIYGFVGRRPSHWTRRACFIHRCKGRESLPQHEIPARIAGLLFPFSVIQSGTTGKVGNASSPCARVLQC